MDGYVFKAVVLIDLMHPQLMPMTMNLVYIATSTASANDNSFAASSENTSDG